MTTWHTAESGAKHVRLSDRTVRDAVKRGDLPAYGVGKALRLKEADLDAWVESQPWEPKASA